MDDSCDGHAAARGNDHRVEFYETEQYLAQTVAEFLCEGLTAGESTMVVATAPHRDAFITALRERWVDVDLALLTGRLVVHDARETLEAFMADSGPDPARFRTAIMDRTDAGARPLRVYGEMVAVLWADGKVGSAIALEDLWNDLAVEREFLLLCAYPISAFDDQADTAAFARVCEQHTSVVARDGCTFLSDDDDEQRRRVIAALQSEVRELRRALESISSESGELKPHRAAPAADLPPAATPPSALPQAAGRGAGNKLAGVLAERLATSLREGDATAASEVLDDGLAAGVSGATLIARVVAPAMHAMGAYWAGGTLTVADEHLATPTCERALAGLYPSLLTHRPRSRERVLVAAGEGEAHGLGPRVIADVLEGRGYDVVYLGADVPADTLAEAVVRHAPELVALSLTMASGAPALGRCIAAVQSVAPEILLLLGGQGIDSHWARVGFPVADTAEQAPRIVEALLRERPDIPVEPPRRRDMAPAVPVKRDPVEHIASIATDLGALARTNALNAQHYRYLALDDPLTGLPNRRAFESYLQQTALSGKQVTLLFVDIDEFKGINDTYGHDAGDALLIEIGCAIADELRPGEVVARLGGDEFGVLLARRANPDAKAAAIAFAPRCSDAARRTKRR